MAMCTTLPNFVAIGQTIGKIYWFVILKRRSFLHRGFVTLLSTLKEYLIWWSLWLYKICIETMW